MTPNDGTPATEDSRFCANGHRPSRPSLSTLAAGPWDLLVIGGGIAGATLLREAAARGLRALMVERDDFAAGASSRSSKLIHGGVHYLARGQIRLARSLVHERERLLRGTGGLVEPVEFLLPIFAGERLRRWGIGGGLCLYEAFAGRLGPPRYLERAALGGRAPGFASNVDGALAYTEGVVDDARLVLRTLADARRLGAQARNGVVATDLLHERSGRVAGALLLDRACGTTVELHARAVVNASGAWAEQFADRAAGADGVRLVRGSHLVFSRDRLPLAAAVAVRHPDLHEAFYALPWEGATIVGSTSVDHRPNAGDVLRPSAAELDYLLRGARWLFPALALDWPDIVSVFSGLRAITDRAACAAARASREFAVWDERGLWSIAGGKLTTARAAAREALDAIGFPARGLLPTPPDTACPSDDHGLAPATARRLAARYGAEGLAAIAGMPAAERAPIPGHRTLWGELRWAARAEDVRHLDDLLLRRVRLGLTEPDGGAGLLAALRPLVQSELAWDDVRWDREADAYLAGWHRQHAPNHCSISRWLDASGEATAIEIEVHRPTADRRDEPPARVLLRR